MSSFLTVGAEIQAPSGDFYAVNFFAALIAGPSGAAKDIEAALSAARALTVQRRFESRRQGDAPGIVAAMADA